MFFNFLNLKSSEQYTETYVSRLRLCPLATASERAMVRARHNLSILFFINVNVIVMC